MVPKGLAANRRQASINVWRSIDAEQPVQSQPLAVLDASTVSSDDTFTYALVMNEADAPLVGFNNGVGFSDRHAWWYYSHMKHEEALLFYTYDGGEPAALAAPRFVFHTAIGDTGDNSKEDESALPRRSIECRCLALF